MSDSLLETFLRYGTNAQRLAFTPDPPTVSGVAVKVLYEWRETDTGDVYVYDTSWHLISSGTATAVTSLTGDVTGTGPGATATTIANNAVTTAKIATTAVTLARIANAAASSKLLGSGASGSGSSYSEIGLGSGLTMTGTTLSAAGTGGTVTHTGALTANQLLKGNGTDDITVGNLTGDVTTSGTMATTIANSAVTLAKIANAAANSKLVGSGASGSGSAYSELTLGSNLSMSGTTLNATGGGTPGGSDKDIQYNNSSAFGGITPGVAGTVLTSNGVSSTASFQAPAGGGGGWVLLDTKTASSSPTLDFTSKISSTYNNYVFLFNNVMNATNTQKLQMLLSSNNGSTWQGSNYYSVSSYMANTGGPAGDVTSAAAQFNLLTHNQDTSFTEGVVGELYLQSPLFNGARFQCFGRFILSNAAAIISMNFGGSQITAGAWNAVRFQYGSGNIASGVIYMYGVTK